MNDEKVTFVGVFQLQNNSKECVSIWCYSYTFISALSEQLYYARPSINIIILRISENILKNIHKDLTNTDSCHMTYSYNKSQRDAQFLKFI